MRKLKHYRKMFNQTQREVANNLGISISMYAQVEQGKKGVSDKLKIKIAKYFNTTVGILFFGEPITNSNKKGWTISNSKSLQFVIIEQILEISLRRWGQDDFWKFIIVLII